MPALQVRDFPEDLYEKLRAYAAANHRSIAQQTIIAVELMVGGNDASAPSHGRGSGAHVEASEEHAFGIETQEELQASKERKIKLLAEIDKYNQEHPPLRNLTQDEFDALMREARNERDRRHDDLVLELSKEGVASCS